MRHFLLIAVLLSSFTAVSAQSDENQISVVFTAYDWAKKGIGDIYYRDGDDFELISMRNLSRTEPYVYKGAKLFQVFKKVPPVEGSREGPTYQVCGETMINQNGGRTLIVISPESNSQSQFDYRIYALEDSLKDFPRNSFRLASFAEETIYFQVEDRKPQQIEPGKRMTIRPDKPGEGYVSIVFKNVEGNTLYSKKWFTEPGVRDLVFLRSYEDRRGKQRLGVRIITEFVLDPKED